MKRSNCYFNAALAAITALAFMAGPAQASLHDPGGAELVPVMVLDDGPPGFALDADVVAEAAELGIDLQDAFDVNGLVVVMAHYPLLSGSQLAHAGQLSPKDDCHNHKAAGERHWHLEGTVERGGPCLKDANGETYHFRNNGICHSERIRFLVIDDMVWPTAGDWEEVATALRDCIQDLPALEPD